MSAARITGGVLVLIGAVSILIEVILGIAAIIASMGAPIIVVSWLIAMIVAVLALIGGILALTGKKVGGGLALASAIIALVCGIIFISGIIPMPNASMFNITDYAFLTFLIANAFGPAIILFQATLEVYLILAGAICILVSSSD